MAETDKDDFVNIIEEDYKLSDIPSILPLMPVRDVVFFTDMLLPLLIGRDKSVKALEEAASQSNFIFLATQKDPGVESPDTDEIYSMGTIGRILRMLKLPDGRIKALVQGIYKAKIIRYTSRKKIFKVKIKIIEEKPVKKLNLKTRAMMRNVREYAEKIMTFRGEMSGDISAILESIETPGRLADLIASNLRMKIDEAQNLLELLDPVKRLEKVNDLLSKEVELSSIQAKIQSDVKDEISKNQRDYFLREQMRAINRELGENDEKFQEISDYNKRIKKARMSKEAEEEAFKQARRLEHMHPESAEYSVVRTYLDWLVQMPWSKSSKDLLKIKNAKKILDKEHYGLEKIKDRILECLSVRILNPKSKGPILCFVGPPGVGKTSLGQAIARAMKRKFVRISLGGIRDEAEIRGHRRTYIGALPGRILQGLKQCKTNNPVFMMDEIDKLVSDFRGDPSSALLEALDPEQKFAFSDNYLNLQFVLSSVMFILTANYTDPIPSALLDRMEVIHIAGYTEEEKRVIAQKYLIRRQIKENGLKAGNINFSTGAIDNIISGYTSEAGLRNLERKIGTICRRVARKIAEGEKGLFRITQKNLKNFIGEFKYYPEMEQETSQIGLATGLAWTQIGGEVLYVETSVLGGKGELIITGQLGEVMQESARAAVSFARSMLDSFGLKKNHFENLDIHIHVPAGAIPKDGPSAGIVMAVSLISVLTQRPVNKDVAMTGEITLSGRVLPIGGLKEKAMGALRAGIHTIIIPEKNIKDISEIPDKIKNKIKFIPVKHMDNVLSEVLI